MNNISNFNQTTSNITSETYTQIKTQTNMNYNSTIAKTSTKSYSQITKEPKIISFLTKHQAILINSLNGTKLEEYLNAIGTVISPTNIIFSSRIANNRICTYLSSKECVDEFLK